MAMNPELNKAEPEALVIDWNMTIKRLNDCGFTTSEIEYLVHHAEEAFPLTDFDLEVQYCLDKLNEEKNAKKTK